MNFNNTNASPKHIPLGTEDKSTRIVYPEPPVQPQHQAKFHLYTQKGILVPTPVDGPRALEIFGDKTFDPRSKFFNHHTLFAQEIMGEANEIIIERMIPPNSKKSEISIVIDILEDDVTITKATDGSPLASPITVPGNKIKYYAVEADSMASDIENGLMVDGGGNSSRMYRLFTVPAGYEGSYYDNIGFVIEPFLGLNVNTDTIKDGVLTYGVSLYTKELASKEVIRTLDSDLYSEFTFKEHSVDPITDKPNNLDDVLPRRWKNFTDPVKPIRDPGIATLRINYQNIETVLGQLANTEEQYLNGLSLTELSFTDFTDISPTNAPHLINFITLKTIGDKQYNTIVFATEPSAGKAGFTEVDLSTNTPVYMRGGSDGDITPSNFESDLIDKMNRYIDPDSEVIDTAINTESIIYDSGFTLPTKLVLSNFVGLRKDTFLALTTHIHDETGRIQTVQEESSIAAILKTKLRLMPESTYFGTPVMRGLISMGSGRMANGIYKYRVPQLLDIAVKAARYMGAGNGAWKQGFIFDRLPGAIVDKVVELEPRFIAAGTKPNLWRNGLVWSQPLDRVQYHYPAMQTVYENDTSVLNSFWTAMAICTLNKYNDEAWRRFTGSTKLSDLELAEEVENFIKNRVKGKFDGMFTIIPTVVFTETDKAKGYSWNLVVEIFANNMKTVMVSKIVSRRASDLTSAP